MISNITDEELKAKIKFLQNKAEPIRQSINREAALLEQLCLEIIELKKELQNRTTNLES